VCCVSWVDAKAFCAWLSKKERAEGRITARQNYRLPHEQEWDKAVGNNKYPWGNEWPPPREAGNYAGKELNNQNWPEWAILADYQDRYARTAPVGSFPPNRYGIYDLGGNLSEWCEDLDSGKHKVGTLRGGSWLCNYPSYLMSSAHRNYDFDCRRDDAGFRVVLDTDAPASWPAAP
jgi:formylglycine-generating enzyme required for sulfatase activity